MLTHDIAVYFRLLLVVSVNSVKTEGLRKVTGSHVHCKSGNVLETLRARDTATDHY